jgi:hypothetical protein
MSKIANVKYHVIDSYFNMGTDLYKKRNSVKLTIIKQFFYQWSLIIEYAILLIIVSDKIIYFPFMMKILIWCTMVKEYKMNKCHNQQCAIFFC